MISGPLYVQLASGPEGTANGKVESGQRLKECQKIRQRASSTLSLYFFPHLLQTPALLTMLGVKEILILFILYVALLFNKKTQIPSVLIKPNALKSMNSSHF